MADLAGLMVLVMTLDFACHDGLLEWRYWLLFISRTSSADKDDDNETNDYLFQLRLAPTTTTRMTSVLDDATRHMSVLDDTAKTATKLYTYCLDTLDV